MNTQMQPTYDPGRWYWLADDGRLFSSATRELVADTDPDYEAWRARGGVATVWPRDAAGQQTDATLRDVLKAAGVLVDLAAYAAVARLRAETGGVATSHGRVATDDRSKVMVLGALLAAQADPTWSTIWQFADGTSARLDAAGIAAVAATVQGHVNQVFGTYATVMVGIAADPPTVTTAAEIDAAFLVAS